MSGRRFFVELAVACWLASVAACSGDAVVGGPQADECETDADCPGDAFCNTPIGCDAKRSCGALMCSAAPPRSYCACDGRVFIDAAKCPSRKHQPFDDAVLPPGDPNRDVEGTPCAAAD